MTRLSLRSYYWGAIVMVVAAGELDTSTTERLAPYLRRLQAGNDLIVDLWDVTRCDPVGIVALDEARERAQEAGWGFAVVVDPAGPCGEAIDGADLETAIPAFHDRHAARAALQHSPS
jgi:anti-anti-sigma regulatory factor